MQKFRKQESTNISPRKVRFCLTSVLQIIIMKKLHRGVAQMVARMVRDHEAASSSLATPTKKNPVISMVTGFFVFFGAAKLASGSTKKVNKFGFFDKKTAQRLPLGGIFFISRSASRGAVSSAVHPQFIRSFFSGVQAVFKRHLSEKLGQCFGQSFKKFGIDIGTNRLFNVFRKFTERNVRCHRRSERNLSPEFVDGSQKFSPFAPRQNITSFLWFFVA